MMEISVGRYEAVCNVKDGRALSYGMLDYYPSELKGFSNHLIQQERR
jgi:hypothetical protein